MNKLIRKEKLQKFKIAPLVTFGTMFLFNLKTYASSTIGTQEVETATQNIKNAVIQLAMPVGSVLMFVSIVMRCKVPFLFMMKLILLLKETMMGQLNLSSLH